MPTLYGQSLTRAELMNRVGDLSQIGGLRRGRLLEGVSDGVEVIELETGAGLRFDVLPIFRGQGQFHLVNLGNVPRRPINRMRVFHAMNGQTRVVSAAVNSFTRQPQSFGSRGKRTIAVVP